MRAADGNVEEVAVIPGLGRLSRSPVRLLAWLLVCISAAGCSGPTQPADLVVENVTVYTGAGGPPFTGYVAVRDGRIVAAGAEAHSGLVADRIVDGSGRFLTPGLWDAHAHVRSSPDGGLDIAQFTTHGVTSVLDRGGYLDRIRTVQDRVERDPTAGPAVYSSYFMLNGESFAGFQRVVDGASSIDAAVSELASAGAAFVKVHRALEPADLPHVVTYAHEIGLPVAGHIPLGLHPLAACQAGMDGVEHTGSLVEALVSVMPEEDAGAALAIDTLLSDAAEPVYRCFAERGVYVTPTLVVYPAIADRRAGGADLPQEFVDFIASMQKIAYRLHRAGIPLLTGTDTSDLEEPAMAIDAGSSLVDELEMLQAAGIPPAAIITMATLNAARFVGVDERTGSIEVGKDADFLLLPRDPGADVANFRSLDAVVRGGVVVAGGLL